ncbi:MAG TPA: DUF3300 domain-containing protein [Granulicella sp.]
MKTIQKALCVVTLGGTALAGFAQAPIVRQPPTPPNYDPSQTYPPQNQSYPPPAQGQYAPPADASQGPPPPVLQPQQLDQLVARIALYPDPLLAQALTAATYPDEIADAATWADQHSSLTGDALGQAIQGDNLPWDPSVLALLPFPSVLDMMAQDPSWTQQLGDAVLAQRQDVMDAVQRQRQQAQRYGYLTSNEYDNVTTDNGYIEIMPLNPTLLYVPAYDPRVVFYAPRPGFVVGGAIRFGPAITIGTTFGRFGWFGAGFGWYNHAIFVDRRPWNRTWVNRREYVHPYVRPYARPVSPRVEMHRGEHFEHRR